MTTTSLTADHTSVEDTLNVSNTEGFLKSSWVQMGNEKVKYTNKTATTFTGLTRGYDNTEAVSHDSGDRVYSPDSEVLNSALGFNVASTGSTVGAISIPVAATSFVFVTMPRIILWNYSWLQEGYLVYLRIVMSFISVGFVIYMSYMIASALGGIMRGIFTRGA